MQGVYITNKFDEFSVFNVFEDLKPDIFGAITESWLLNDAINTAEISYPGYVVYRQDRVDTHRYFGVVFCYM